MAENRDLTQAQARLDALTDWERRPRNTMRVGLEPMQDLARRLGDPQKSFRAIHVAGTKGKGSVSALIEAALAHAGLRVGRYASPHVERITERVSVQGRDVDEPTLARALDRALDGYEAARAAGTPAANATWFDLLTASAFLIFREAAVEWAVVEVGLGGRLDSTNIVDGEIAVVTNIALEHTEILGHTRAAIAGEKVGILKPGAVLVTTLGDDDEAGRVVQARAGELGARVK
ncbi:MAG: Mur ligase family protein, partial [Roseiarcus sp.]